MSGDYSRITFDPWQDDLGVLLQQGRPLSDAEWNSLALQIRRRIHVGTLDTIGAAVVPMQTPDGFKIGISGSNLTIGRGRLYVDGMLAENHGSGSKAWDARLEEEIGTKPLFYVAPPADPDAGQPYYPDPPPLPVTGRHLVYLDVWTREVNYLIRPELIEKAVGVDSTTRLQTVWQVKLLNNVGTTANCSTPLDQIPGWLPANAPSAGRLTTSTVAVPGEPDPCLIPPGGGYKGLENQLYRVEIQKGGGLGTATFKWSRDNASVETRITHIPALNQLTVESTHKDSVLRFSDGDWVEITDDWRELHNQPGELRRIKIGNGVDDATRTILLEAPLTAGMFPTNAQNQTQPGRHTRIKRWDQRGKVLDQNGNVLQDLDLAVSTGDITVPAGAGVGVLLEHSVIAQFSLDPAGGEFKAGDCWIFAARSTDATIEELDKAPPRAIHHHYAKLGFVTFPSGITDCRIFWPPPMGDGGKEDNCACTVCVTPEQHKAGNPSIQDAIDKVIAAGGGNVCLQVGVYDIQKPLHIIDATSLRIVGKGIVTELVSDLAVFETIDKSKDIGLSHFSALSRGGGGSNSAITVRSVDKIDIEHLRIIAENQSAGIALADSMANVSIRHNTIQAFTGIVSLGSPSGAGTALMELSIDDNEFACDETAIALSDVTVHQSVSRITGNRVVECRKAGFILTGATAPGFGMEISGNALHVLGDGIQAGLDGLRIIDNSIVMFKKSGGAVGIRLIKGLTGDNGLDACQIVGNLIFEFPSGIEMSVPLATVMIERNQIQGAERGIITSELLPVRNLSMVGNQITGVTEIAINIESFAMNNLRARVSTSDNQIEAATPKTAMSVVCRDGDCVFSDNQCVHTAAKDDPSVLLMGRTLIAASNRVLATGKSSMLLQPGMTGELPDCTVLGNIASGNIDIGSLGAGLPAPWKPLNRTQV